MKLMKYLAVAAILAFKKLWPSDRSIVVFAVESFGSLGDQAMMEVVRDHSERIGCTPTFVYMPGARPTPLRKDVKSLVLPSASGLVPKMLRTVAVARTVLAIGADVLDGTYNRFLPFQWIGKLTRAQQVGAKVGIVNFSFSEFPDEAVCQRIQTTKGFQFTARDPVSLNRFTDSTGQSATLSADLAFLLRPELCSQNALQANQWLSECKNAGDTVLFVNLSGHTLALMPFDGVDEIALTLSRWLDESDKRKILFLPHDFRPAPIGDVEVLERLAEILSVRFSNRLAVLRAPFDAWDVKALCAHADLALTGRMHLAIACLGMLVPPVCITYVGKFEGLMQHVGLEHEGLLIEPGQVSDTSVLLSALSKVTAQKVRLQGIIASRIDAVRSLSLRNLEWI